MSSAVHITESRQYKTVMYCAVKMISDMRRQRALYKYDNKSIELNENRALRLRDAAAERQVSSFHYGALQSPDGQ